MKAIVKVPEKKRIYRVVEVNDKKYLIDTEEHKLSYIFPMINWFIPKKAKELTDEKLKKLKPQKLLNKEEKKERKQMIWGVIGSGMLIFSATKGYVEYFDVQSSSVINVLAFLSIVIMAIAIRMYASMKMKDKSINFKSYDYKIIYIPSLKLALAVLVVCGFYSLMLIEITISYFHDGIDNLIVPISYLIALVGFLFSNIFFILPGEAKVKIKKSK